MGVFVQAIRSQRAVARLRPPSASASTSEGTPGAAVSVIIPARDEEEGIESTVRSLLATTAVELEIIIVNDGSSDRTGPLADALAHDDPRVRVIHDPALAPGWLGKTNAMRAGAAAAVHPRLLFTDADIHFAPETLAAALAECERLELDFLSLVPRFRWRTVFEHALSAVFFLALGQFGSPRINDPDYPETAVGVGAFLLVSRATYDDVGGHERVKSAILDDVAFARMLKRAGKRVWFAFAPELLNIRMYTSNRAALFAIEKNILASAGKRWWALLFVPFAFAPLFWGGPVAAAVGAATGDTALLALGAALYLFQLATLQLLRVWHDFQFAKLLLFPLVVVTLTICITRATWRYLRHGKVRWRGRDVELTIEH